MTYSAIYDGLHYHVDLGNPMAKTLRLLSSSRHLDSAIDQYASEVDCILMSHI